MRADGLRKMMHRLVPLLVIASAVYWATAGRPWLALLGFAVGVVQLALAFRRRRPLVIKSSKGKPPVVIDQLRWPRG